MAWREESGRALDLAGEWHDLMGDWRALALNLQARLFDVGQQGLQGYIDFVVEVFEKLMQRRNETKGLSITYEQPFLRHFTAHFEQD